MLVRNAVPNRRRNISTFSQRMNQNLSKLIHNTEQWLRKRHSGGALRNGVQQARVAGPDRGQLHSAGHVGLPQPVR